MRQATVPDQPVASDGGAPQAPDLLERCAVLLRHERSTLLARAARRGVDIAELQTLTATHGQGETEHATSGTERAIAELLEADTLGVVDEITAALTRIDDGSYGICTGCGVHIGAERLLAMPQTRYCVTCRQAEDRRGR